MQKGEQRFKISCHERQKKKAKVSEKLHLLRKAVVTHIRVVFTESMLPNRRAKVPVDL